MKHEALCINTLRMLSVDMVEAARSGHPGLPLGAAAMAHVLWSRFLKHNPRNPLWPDRDRFVFSPGHGSALLYSLLHLAGYDLTLDDLKRFRQWGSRTPGHPEYGHTPGVECTTGPLGQGFAMAVGMAAAERWLAARFNREGHDVVDHHTYALVSDGDLMEGVAAEAASLAGHLRLGKLICLYDDNGMTLSGETRLCFTENVGQRFEAYGWHVARVEDGNDTDGVAAAIAEAREERERPSLLCCRTTIAFGSPGKQNTFHAHGSPLGPDETAATRKNLGWPTEQDFHVPAEAAAVYREAALRGAAREEAWKALMDSYAKKHPDLAALWRTQMDGALPEGWEEALPAFEPDPKGMATRVAGGRVLESLAQAVSFLVGGSGDLDPSTNTATRGRGSFQPEGTGGDGVQGAVPGTWSYGGANVAFGVREHAMAAMCNGMALHGGIIPYAATFLVFSDYMRPAMRLSALMGRRVVYVFTHDSISVGEDGPTHQPVEQAAGLRAVPNLAVIRPADANETSEAWRAALKRTQGPTALLLSRQSLPVLDRSGLAPAAGLHRGAYVLADPPSWKPEIIIIASGSEVHLALGAFEALVARGTAVRVVSMPSWELFEEQPESYRREVLPPEVKGRLAVEAGSGLGWHRYAGTEGRVLSVERFGASAPGPVVMEKLGMTVDSIVAAAGAILGTDRTA
jgi:transketolase